MKPAIMTEMPLTRTARSPLAARYLCAAIALLPWGLASAHAEMVLSQVSPSWLPNQPSSVAGKRISELAKIGGITPDMFSLNGRCELWPPYTRLPTWRLA